MCCFRLVKGKVFINMGPCSEPVILLSRFLHISSNSPFPDPHSGRPAHFSDFSIFLRILHFPTPHGRPAHFSDFSIFLRILHFPTPMVVDQPISPISPNFFEFSTSLPPMVDQPFLRFLHISSNSPLLCPPVLTYIRYKG